MGMLIGGLLVIIRREQKACLFLNIGPLKALQHKVGVARLDELAERTFGDLFKGIVQHRTKIGFNQ
ncbi:MULTISPECIES: hypothetical protein [Sphingobacterium]|nr:MULTISPECIES: hypothetical protein [Sphingobacterium]